MATSQTYKAFVASPSYILNLSGELLDSTAVLAQLTSEIRSISSYATYVTRNDTQLGNELAHITATAPAEAGRRAGVTMPEFLATGRSGRSRKEKLVQYNVVTSYRSWQECIKAVNGESDKYVSQGWKRTVKPHPGRNVSWLFLRRRKLPTCRTSLIMLLWRLKTSAGLAILCRTGAGIAVN